MGILFSVGRKGVDGEVEEGGVGDDAVERERDAKEGGKGSGEDIQATLGRADGAWRGEEFVDGEVASLKDANEGERGEDFADCVERVTGEFGGGVGWGVWRRLTRRG